MAEENRIVKKFQVKDNTEETKFSPDFLIGSTGECVSVQYNDREVNLQQAINSMLASLRPTAEFNTFISSGLDEEKKPEVYDKFIDRIVDEVMKRINSVSFKQSPVIMRGTETVNINEITENREWKELMIVTLSIVNTKGANNRNIYQAIVPKTMLDNKDIILKDKCSTQETGKDRNNLAAIISGGGGNYNNVTVNEHLCTWEIAREQIRIRLLNESGMDVLKNASHTIVTYFYWR